MEWVNYFIHIVIWKYALLDCQDYLYLAITWRHEFPNEMIAVLQSIERMWMTFNKGDCESMAYINMKLSNNLESFLRALQNTTDGSCDCQLMLENIQRRLQK